MIIWQQLYYHAKTNMAAPSQLVQYVIVRSDLIKSCKWKVGAVIAQACHATTAVLHMFYEDSHTQAYLKDLDRMHKIILEVWLPGFTLMNSLINSVLFCTDFFFFPV